MSDALTLINRESKEDVDLPSLAAFTARARADFPSYFDNINIFYGFLTPPARIPFLNGCVVRKCDFPSVNAFMAIV
jgi:hypothetical protein